MEEVETADEHLKMLAMSKGVGSKDAISLNRVVARNSLHRTIPVQS